MYCEICKKDYHNLSNHLILKHKISPKDYFDEYLKTEENSHCKLCHAELKDFIKLSWGYGTYCKECSNKDKLKYTWNLKTKDELDSIYEKRKETLKDIYGEDWKEQFTQKQIESCRNRSPEKQALVSKHHHDERMSRANKKMVAACRATKLKNHGDATYNNVEQARKTYFERTGYVNPYYNPEVIEHRFDAYERRTGFRNPSHNPEVISKMRARYYYDGQRFDSSWELAYYIWLKDHNIPFEFHIDPIDYSYQGKRHRYFPDFKVKNELVEIKGPQLLKLMQESNSLDNAKYRCMIDHNVKIITDCSEYLNYIEKKYGEDYMQQFRDRKSEIFFLHAS